MTSLHPDDSVFFLVFHSKQVWHSSNYTSTHRNNNICTNTPTHAGTRTHIQFKCAHKSTSFTVYICIFLLFRTITNTHSLTYLYHAHKQIHTYFAQIHAHTQNTHVYILTHTRNSNGPMQKAHTLGYHTFIFLISKTMFSPSHIPTNHARYAHTR